MKLRNLLPGAAAACLLALAPLGHAHDGSTMDVKELEQLLAQVRKATQKYLDVANASPDFAPQFGCVAQPGAGGMGIHYIHVTRPGDAKVDPLEPEALIYEPDENGKLQLVGVEYIVFAEAWDAVNAQPPVLFGHPFHLVRGPNNRYGLPSFYELHLWLWKHNRMGMFNDWNPAVKCP